MTSTICELLIEKQKKHPNHIALSFVRNGRWIEYTWQNYFNEVQLAAAGLSELGLQAGDRIGICANTRPEWAWADMAIVGIKAITVPATSIKEQKLRALKNKNPIMP